MGGEYSEYLYCVLPKVTDLSQVFNTMDIKS
jgi:hypothetical protein